MLDKQKGRAAHTGKSWLRVTFQAPQGITSNQTDKGSDRNGHRQAIPKGTNQITAHNFIQSDWQKLGLATVSVAKGEDWEPSHAGHTKWRDHPGEQPNIQQSWGRAACNAPTPPPHPREAPAGTRLKDVCVNKCGPPDPTAGELHCGLAWVEHYEPFKINEPMLQISTQVNTKNNTE